MTKQEIIWNLVNSALAGALVFFGACTTGNVTLQSIIAALAASGIVAVTQFKDYWSSKPKCLKTLGTFL